MDYVNPFKSPSELLQLRHLLVKLLSNKFHNPKPDSLRNTAVYSMYAALFYIALILQTTLI